MVILPMVIIMNFVRGLSLEQEIARLGRLSSLKVPRIGLMPALGVAR
jgi:hypothetical protein